MQTGCQRIANLRKFTLQATNGIPNYLSLEEAIDLAEQNKIEVVTEFIHPQLALHRGEMSYWYRFAGNRFELYAYYKER